MMSGEQRFPNDIRGIKLEAEAMAAYNPAFPVPTFEFIFSDEAFINLLG